MPINTNKLSKMAKLNLSGDESMKIEKCIEVVVRDLEKLNEVDTERVEPFIYAAELTNVLREDKVAKKISREELLANAPEQTTGCFKVPKTVE